MTKPVPQKTFGRLGQTARLSVENILNRPVLDRFENLTPDSVVLVILAAGKGTRFGRAPKCIQPVHDKPLARHSIDAFRQLNPSPVIGVVGYRHAEVSAALGSDNLYVRSADPAGGTALAAFEALSVPGLLERNPLLVITMGDRIVTPAVFQRLQETHRVGAREAELTFLTALYEPPKNQGKGRVLRDANQRVLRIVEQRDIDALENQVERQRLMDLTEGNCPLYAIRAATLHRYLCEVTNQNAQHQFYLTDIVEAISQDGGDIRTITTTVADREYDLLCSDVTRSHDLALLEGILAASDELMVRGESIVDRAAREIAADRPAVQVAAIARQLEELIAVAAREKLEFQPGQPVAIGISGGRLRIAFMHPDMGRFFGPAWQMPIGAGQPDDDEQIVMLAQTASDQQIHLFPTNPRYRENVNYVAADAQVMYPGEDVSDWHTYEEFGTRMSESLLLSLGYFSDDELEARRQKNVPLPPPTLWVSSNMRRPFSLVGNAIASLRTLRKGNLGIKVQKHLGRDHFRGLRLVSTGNIPQGGFSSSSAVTVATKNAINALYDLGIPADLLVHLACQAEYGTGVRAGSLDQATEQKGQPGLGTLISSNPRDNYRVLGTYSVPAERFQVIFPYSVHRDREAWRWSWGAYAEVPAPGRLTTTEMRKLTGKSTEIAAILTQLPHDTDFFKPLEDDLLEDGLLSPENRAWICRILRQIPLLITQEELRARVYERREWYMDQLIETSRLSPTAASQKTDATLASLFTGWRDPVLRRFVREDGLKEATGVPLRAMVAYLFAEVAKNFCLIHRPEQWIEYVTRSQRGDRCVNLDPDALPAREIMEGRLDWERKHPGPARLNLWLIQHGATPFNYNAGLEDAALDPDNPPEFQALPGSNFFRGLALIDLAEAMLKRAFGKEAVAVRINAAGQGDYFQVHIDTQKANVAQVKDFLRKAFYHRFGLSPDPEFVEVHPGGGAVGVRLDRYDALPLLLEKLKAL